MWSSFRNLFHRVQNQQLLATWFTIHSGAGLAAFYTLWSLLQCAWALLIGKETNSDCSPPQLLARFYCIALFGVTFYRFSIGDLRYLSWMDATEEGLKKWERERLKGDLIALNMRALVFTGLAQSVSEPSFFFLSFAVLLLVDIPWLYVRHAGCSRVARTDETLTRWHLSQCQNCEKTLLRWLVNNTVTLVVLITLFVSRFWLKAIGASDFIYLSVAACITNCLVDIIMTKWVYRPSKWR